MAGRICYAGTYVGIHNADYAYSRKYYVLNLHFVCFESVV